MVFHWIVDESKEELCELLLMQAVSIMQNLIVFSNGTILVGELCTTSIRSNDWSKVKIVLKFVLVFFYGLPADH